MPDVSLNGIEFTIKGSSDAASSSIETLNSNLQALRSSLSSASGMNAFANGIKKLGDAINGLGSSDADKAASTLEKVAKSVSTFSVFGDVAKSVGSFSRSLTKLAENPDGLEQVSEILSEISLIDFTNIQQAGEGLRNIAAASKEIAKINPAAKSAKDGIKGIAKETKRATGPLANFVASLKRIAFYRILRSILKSISQALQEGLKNAYEYSKLTGGELSASLDLISTKSLTMKNQLGAAFGSLIVAVTPILIQIIQIVNAVASAITRLIAILGGKSTWTRAKDVWTEWGEAAGGAGGAAKEALKYLAPFDELNRLPDDSGRGGGGGPNTPDYSEMFETVSTDVGAGLLDSITEAFTSLGDWFEGKDWSDLGSKAWDGLIDALKDEGKATAAVSAISEALGAAVGSVASFAQGFGTAAVESIIGQFKKELKDYNGNEKIDIVDFLTAAWNAASIPRQWFDENVFGQFFGGFIEAFTGYEPSEEEKSSLGATLRDLILKLVTNPNELFFELQVVLTKKGWTTIAGWANELAQKGEEVASAAVELAKSGWSSLTEWVESTVQKGKDTVSVGVNFVKNGWTSLSAWLNDNKCADVWREVKTWISKAPGTGWNWTSLNAWLNTHNCKDIWRQVMTWITKGDAKTGEEKWTSLNKWLNDHNCADIWREIKTKITKGNWTTISKWLTDLGTKVTSGSISVAVNLIKQGWTTVTDWVKNALGLNNVNVNVTASGGSRKASGGAYYGGSWHSIPQYARGGRPHGTMFWAGEAGPEVVGHVGGRTEVLNQSQLAATMYASVSAALSGLRFAMTAPAAPDGSMGGSDDALYNAFVRALESADFAVDNTINMDGDTVYRGVVRRNQQRRRQLGYNPMLT